jgi:tetratricopeptide (TPR) repeat protein
MNNNPFRQNNDEIRELVMQFLKMKSGKRFTFIEEEGFEIIADYFIQKDQFAEALEAADFGINQFPYSPSLLVIKADILLSLRRYEDCLFYLNKAYILDSNDANLFIIKTDALLALDKQEEAAQLLESVLNSFEGEDKINLLFELADVYDDYENFEKVFNCLTLILQQDPNNEEALYKICFWTDYTGRNEEAITLYHWILDNNPYNELAWFNLGAAYQGIKLYEKSIDAYQYAIAINEKFDYAYRNIGDAYIRLKKYKEAIEVLEKVLELSAPEAVIYEAIGHSFDKLHNYAQARFNYKKASHLNQEDSQMHYKIACTYMNERNWQNAIKSLHAALKFHLLQPEYNLALGRCHMQLEDYDEAITYIGNFVRIRPKNINGWIELLNCFYKGRLFEEGFEYAVTAFEHTDAKPIFVYFKSLFLFAMGQSKQALIYLENALRSNPKLVKNFIEINPTLLQNQQVVDLIARYKKSKPAKSK